MAGRNRDEERESATYYTTSCSDRSYAAKARERMRGEGRKRWLIRLLFVVLLAVGIWQWGDDVLNLVRAEAGSTAQEFKQVGEGIRGGAERRAGAGLDE